LASLASLLFNVLGSVAIGVLLVIVAVTITWEIKAMIVGESAEPQLRKAIEQHIRTQAEIKTIMRLITLQWGDRILVLVRAEMMPVPSAEELVAAINRVENSIQTRFPQAQWLFFEPDVPTQAPKR
ncbi:MAG: cation efflux family transporter, partial [Burkholderiaceae bacterium]